MNETVNKDSVLVFTRVRMVAIHKGSPPCVYCEAIVIHLCYRKWNASCLSHIMIPTELCPRVVLA